MTSAFLVSRKFSCQPWRWSKQYFVHRRWSQSCLAVERTRTLNKDTKWFTEHCRIHLIVYWSEYQMVTFQHSKEAFKIICDTFWSPSLACDYCEQYCELPVNIARRNKPKFAKIQGVRHAAEPGRPAALHRVDRLPRHLRPDRPRALPRRKLLTSGKYQIFCLKLHKPSAVNFCTASNC